MLHFPDFACQPQRLRATRRVLAGRVSPAWGLRRLMLKVILCPV
jgi:hypothetical protein